MDFTVIMIKALMTWGIFSALGLAYFMLRGPTSIKTLLSAWLSRGRFVVGFVAGDNGYITIRNLTSTLGQGIFETGKGKNKIKMLLTRPISNVENPPEDYKENKEKTTAFNQIIKSRYFSDVGKPCYFGYDGKAALSNPLLIKTLADAEGRQPVEGDLTLLDPADLKVYIPRAINPSQLDNIEDTAYQRGLTDKPLQDMAEKVIPYAVILIICIALYLILTGELKIPGVSL